MYDSGGPAAGEGDAHDLLHLQEAGVLLQEVRSGEPVQRQAQEDLQNGRGPAHRGPHKADRGGQGDAAVRERGQEEERNLEAGLRLRGRAEQNRNPHHGIAGHEQAAGAWRIRRIHPRRVQNKRTNWTARQPEIGMKMFSIIQLQQTTCIKNCFTISSLI